MTLDQMAVLLDSDARDRHLVLQAHLDDLARRMQEMEHSRAMTQHALECRAHDVATCPHFRQGVRTCSRAPAAGPSGSTDFALLRTATSVSSRGSPALVV